MDKSIIEAIKGKSREERTEFFKQHKAELLPANDLENVSGGSGNTSSEVPDGSGNYYSSWGFMCHGQLYC